MQQRRHGTGKKGAKEEENQKKKKERKKGERGERGDGGEKKKRGRAPNPWVSLTRPTRAGVDHAPERAEGGETLEPEGPTAMAMAPQTKTRLTWNYGRIGTLGTYLGAWVCGRHVPRTVVPKLAVPSPERYLLYPRTEYSFQPPLPTSWTCVNTHTPRGLLAYKFPKTKLGAD